MLIYYASDNGNVLFTVDGDPDAPPPGDYINVPDDTPITPLEAFEVSGGALFDRVVPVMPDHVDAEIERRLRMGTGIAVTGIGDIPVQGRDRDMTIFPNLRDSAKELQEAGITAAVLPFRDRDNVTHMLTPTQMLELVSGARMAAQALYSAMWDLKDANPIPQDYTDDSYWPVSS
jgi:hypothetical protein